METYSNVVDLITLWKTGDARFFSQMETILQTVETSADPNDHKEEKLFADWRTFETSGEIEKHLMITSDKYLKDWTTYSRTVIRNFFWAKRVGYRFAKDGTFEV